MLSIKILLTVGALALFFYFFVAARGRPIQKLAISAVFIAIAVFTVFPDLSHKVAHLVGVGRGVDLALYLSTLTLLCLCFNLYLGHKRLEERLQVVVRELALITARPPGAPAAEADAGRAADEPR